MKKISSREMMRSIPTFHSSNSSIGDLITVFKCNKCNKYNSIFEQNIQLCLFCGNPNYIKKK